MKNLGFKSLVALGLALVALLTGCGKPDPSTVRSVNQSIGSVVDAGAVPLPNRPGYKLRHYEVLREMQTRHYLYVIEKDEVPVAGVQTQASEGKSQVSVDTLVLPLQALRTCKDMQACVAEVERLKKDQDFQRYLELKAKYEAPAPKR